FDLALAEICRGTKRAERHDAGLLNFKVDGARKAYGLVETSSRRPLSGGDPRRRSPQYRFDDQRTPRRR
ncbi:MAG TPA: hypothetical protein VMJ52_18845, partial [Xanthobacteraceae bacterium]|nr:hypothetical protein [Xanthobacteraceae bacterium]